MFGVDVPSNDAVLDKITLETKYVETIRMLFDKNYQINRDQIHYSDVIYDRIAGCYYISVYTLDYPKYHLDFEAYSGVLIRARPVAQFANREFCTSGHKLPLNKLIELSNSYFKMLGIDKTKMEYVSQSIGGEGCISLEFMRKYKGYYFKEDAIKLAFSYGGNLTSYLNYTFSPNPTSTEIRISKEKAKELATKQFINLFKLRGDDLVNGIKIKRISGPALFIVNPNYAHKTNKYLINNNMNETRLAWVTNIKFSSKHADHVVCEVWIDAQSGELLGGWTVF